LCAFLVIVGLVYLRVHCYNYTRKVQWQFYLCMVNQIILILT